MDAIYFNEEINKNSNRKFILFSELIKNLDDTIQQVTINN